MNQALQNYALFGSLNAKINDVKITDTHQCSGRAGYDSDQQKECDKFGPGWDHVPEKDPFDPNNQCPFDNGWNGYCVLRGAHADPTACCIGGTSQTSSAACASTYVDNRFSSTSCRDKWQNVCRPQDFVDDSEICATMTTPTIRIGTMVIPGQTLKDCKPENPCFRYAETNPNDSYVVSRLSPYCSNNLTNARCRDFCLDNPGACDSGVKAYCARSDKDVQFCSCINSPAAAFDGLNPVCVDNDCKTSASYRTAAMNQIRECTTVNCNIIQNLTAGGKINLTDNVTNQKCGVNKTETPGGSVVVVDTTPDAPTAPTNPTSPNSSSNSQESDEFSLLGFSKMQSMSMIAGVVFFILMIVVIFIIILSGGGKNMRRRFDSRRRQ